MNIQVQRCTKPESARGTQLIIEDGSWIGRFRAMACPCEVLIDCDSAHTAAAVLEEVSSCAWRIEDKYSRYRTGNIVHAINTSNGRPVTVDEETANLLDFAATLHQLSIK